MDKHHEMGYEAYSTYGSWYDAKTVNIQIILNPQAPDRDITIGVSDEPIPRRNPVKQSMTPQVK